MIVFTVKREAFFFWRPPCICPSCILRTHASLISSSAFEKMYFECEDFFPLSPESLLPWQQQWSRSEGSWACERVSWACRGMAVPNKQALSLTVSRVLLLLPSHCSPSPPPLTPLLSFDIRLLYSWFVVQLVSTLHSPPTDSPSYVF